MRASWPARVKPMTGLIVAVFGLAGDRASAGQWSTGTPMLAPAGQAAIVTGNDGRFYIFGGWSTNPPALAQANKLQIYDPSSNTWSWGATLPTWTIGGAAVCLPDGMIHLFSAAITEGTVSVYDPVTDTWGASHEANWFTYSARAVRTPDNRYFIFGGEWPVHNCYEYFPDTFTAEQRTDVPDVPDPEYNTLQYPGTYMDTSGRIYVIGGLPHLWKVHGPRDNVARYNPADDHWTTDYTPMPTARFTFGHVQGWNGFFYAIGGSSVYYMQDPPYYDVVEYYDPAADVWHTGVPLPEGRRESAAAVNEEGVIYVFGGCGPPDGDYVNTVYTYDTMIGIEGPSPADFDRDGDVDEDDYVFFQSCETGPGIPQPDSACSVARLDGDDDVDQEDFGLFQRCLSGTDLPADPGCMN